MSTDWPSYMRRVTAGATQVQIAEQTGIEQTSISRWLLGKDRPRAELVIQFARAYNRSPVEALIAAGYLNTDEIGGVIELEADLSAVSPERMFDELRRQFTELQRKLEAINTGGQEPLQWPSTWTAAPATPPVQDPGVSRYQNGSQ